MANKVLQRRGLKANLPTLDVGELGLAVNTGELFIGTPGGNVLVNVITSVEKTNLITTYGIQTITGRKEFAGELNYTGNYNYYEEGTVYYDGTEVDFTNANVIGLSADNETSSLKLIRARGSTGNLTSVGIGNTVGSVTVTESVGVGDTLAIEVNSTTGYTNQPKIIFATIRTTSTSSNNSASNNLGWTANERQTGTLLHTINNYGFVLSANGTTISFNNKQRNFLREGANQVMQTETYHLAVGRIWKVF